MRRSAALTFWILLSQTWRRLPASSKVYSGQSRRPRPIAPPSRPPITQVPSRHAACTTAVHATQTKWATQTETTQTMCEIQVATTQTMWLTQVQATQTTLDTQTTAWQAQEQGHQVQHWL